jgi:aryl-alcohol dehydrogenase-like predicted oxidoreductase
MSWLVSQSEIATVIAGATAAEQVRANAAAVESWRLDEDDLAEIDDLLS